MDIVLRYSPGCPNWVEAEHLMRDALHIVGAAGATLTREVIERPEEAVAARFMRLTDSRGRLQNRPLAIVADAWDHHAEPGWGSARWIGPT